MGVATAVSGCQAILGGFDYSGPPTGSGGGAGRGGAGTGGGNSACFDGVKDGQETDVDCGGACPKCGIGRHCLTGADCVNAFCANGACAATCTDGVQDGMETDVDCGGPSCGKCAPGKACVSASDCATMPNEMAACNNNKCSIACAPGWGGCANPTSCTTDLTTVMNCGACGVACSAYCASGACNDPVAAAMGTNHICAILGDGSVWCWGDDSKGQLGDGMVVGGSASPKKVTALPKAATAIAAGDTNTCAILSDQTLWCWGDNTKGALGVGDSAPHSGPQQVAALGGVSQVAVGGSHVCAIDLIGDVYCWGVSGVGNSADAANAPVKVLSFGSKVTAGSMHTCALLLSGSVSCWGANGSGQLGNGTLTSSNTPTSGATGLTGVVEVATNACSSSTCARTTSGVYCWGDNTRAQLGDGTTTSPQNAPSATPIALVGATAVAVGCFAGGAITSGGLYLWGTNVDSTLGDGTNNPEMSPAKSSLGNVGMLMFGGPHSCALTVNHKLFCWGGDLGGFLGTGTTPGNDVGMPTAVVWP